MILGNYVGLIEIEFEIDENEKDLRSFDELKEAITGNELVDEIRGILEDEIVGKCGSVKVTTQHANLYRVEDEK